MIILFSQNGIRQTLAFPYSLFMYSKIIIFVFRLLKIYAIRCLLQTAIFFTFILFRMLIEWLHLPNYFLQKSNKRQEERVILLPNHPIWQFGR